jgi:hypothetical protein
VPAALPLLLMLPLPLPPLHFSCVTILIFLI